MLNLCELILHLFWIKRNSTTADFDLTKIKCNFHEQKHGLIQLKQHSLNQNSRLRRINRDKLNQVFYLLQWSLSFLFIKSNMIRSFWKFMIRFLSLIRLNRDSCALKFKNRQYRTEMKTTEQRKKRNAMHFPRIFFLIKRFIFKYCVYSPWMFNWIAKSCKGILDVKLHFSA